MPCRFDHSWQRAAVKAPSRIPSRKLGHAALPGSRASSVSRSCTEAGTTATASQVPSASTRATRLRPSTFLAASYPRGPRTGMHLTACVSMRFCQGSCQRLWPTGAWSGIGPPFTAGRTRMRCLECGSEAVSERPERTAQGYRRFRCRQCAKQFNERSGGMLNRTQYPSDVIALVVLWRLRYKLSLRDLPEMFAVRGIVFSYEAVREWEAKLTPALAEDLRRRRRGKVGRSWYVDETYLKVQGRWCYLYRAIDRSGALVDVMFSERRDMAAAKAFFRSA